MSNVLHVFHEGVKVGKLTRDSEHIYAFKYDDAWLSHAERFPLSFAMPLQAEPFGNKVTLSFFENLLPEGEVKDSLSKHHELNSPFAFLQAFGQDCAGAVTLTTGPLPPCVAAAQLTQVKVDRAAIDRAIDDRQSVAAVVSGLNPGYLSVAGAQDKFPANYCEGDLFLPANGAPTTHIVKPPVTHSGIKESVFNEYYCMMLAKRVGLNVPRCIVCDAGKHPLFVIERYDRYQGSDGVIRRLHQQDFCQAQGLVAEEKYEAMGGASLQDNYRLLVKHVRITQRIKAALDFLDWVGFNLLIGNHDSHSKNIAFLMPGEGAVLAPFYDLLCTAIYPKLSRQFAFKIAGCDDVSKIGPKQFLQLDKLLAVKSGTVCNRVRSMAEKLLNHKDVLADEMLLSFPEVKIFERIASLIEKRCKGLVSQGMEINQYS